MAMATQETTAPIVGAASTIIRRVSDLNRSLDFYSRVLGLPVKMRVEAFAFLDAGPVTLALNQLAQPAAAVTAGMTEIVFEVADITRAYETLRSRGVAFLFEPRVVSQDATHDLLAAAFRDPDGHAISITSRRGMQ